MLEDKHKDALRQWYRQPRILDEARQLIARKRWEELEQLIHMRSLMPLTRAGELPDYLKTDDGSALLPSVDPRSNLEEWQDAIEVGWEVVEAELGVSHDDVHRSIGNLQKDDWDAFTKSVDERKRVRDKQDS